MQLSKTAAMAFIGMSVLAVEGAQKGGVKPKSPVYYGGMTRHAWFDQPGIQKQIGFTKEQLQTFHKAHAQSWNKIGKDIEGLGKAGTATFSEGINKLSQTFNQSFSKATQDILKPEQAQRFEQLYLQYRGLGAFNDPQVYGKLKLSDEQRATLGKAADSYHQSMMSLYKDLPDKEAQATKRFEELSRQSAKTLLRH